MGSRKSSAALRSSGKLAGPVPPGLLKWLKKIKETCVKIPPDNTAKFMYSMYLHIIFSVRPSLYIGGFSPRARGAFLSIYVD